MFTSSFQLIDYKIYDKDFSTIHYLELVLFTIFFHRNAHLECKYHGKGYMRSVIIVAVYQPQLWTTHVRLSVCVSVCLYVCVHDN